MLTVWHIIPVVSALPRLQLVPDNENNLPENPDDDSNLVMSCSLFVLMCNVRTSKSQYFFGSC
jgi:hypothetical protein